MEALLFLVSFRRNFTKGITLIVQSTHHLQIIIQVSSVYGKTNNTQRLKHMLLNSIFITLNGMCINFFSLSCLRAYMLGSGSFLPVRFGLGRFGQFWGWVVFGLGWWVVSAPSYFAPISIL